MMIWWGRDHLVGVVHLENNLLVVERSRGCDRNSETYYTNPISFVTSN